MHSGLIRLRLSQRHRYYARPLVSILALMVIVGVAGSSSAGGQGLDGSDAAVLRQVQTACARTFRELEAGSSELLPPGARQPPSVSTAAVATFANQIRDMLLRQLGLPALSALRDYVANRFPEPPRPDLFDPALRLPQLSAGRAGTFIDDMRAFVSRISDLRQLSVDLQVTTIPTDVDVQLSTVALSRPIARTNTILRGVYRGLYTLRLTKPGFQSINDTIDLVGDNSSALECVLAANDDQLANSSCRRR
jgi:hypothetical protein